MLSKTLATLKSTLCLLLAWCLSFFFLVLSPSSANAIQISAAEPTSVDLGAAQSLTVAEAQSRLSAISAECDSLNSDIFDLQNRIDELAEKTMQAQNKMLEGQDALAEAARREYKDGIRSTSMLELMLNSKDWNQLNKNMESMEQVIAHQNKIVQTQKELKAEFESQSKELIAQKDAQDAKLSELDSKRQEAEDVVARVTKEAVDAANMAKLQQSAAQVTSKAQKPYASNQGNDSRENPPSQNASNSGQVNQGSNASPGNDSSVGTNGSWVAPISTNWNTGKATGYDILGGTCANGTKYTEHTMGVAISIYTPGYRNLIKNRMIQINYGNKTVYAYIMDGGGFAKYGVSLDLQRAVYRALLGNQSIVAKDWGRRTVSYRLI